MHHSSKIPTLLLARKASKCGMPESFVGVGLWEGGQSDPGENMCVHVWVFVCLLACLFVCVVCLSVCLFVGWFVCVVCLFAGMCICVCFFV